MLAYPGLTQVHEPHCSVAPSTHLTLTSLQSNELNSDIWAAEVDTGEAGIPD